jgi:hypothetical protein
MLTGTEICPCAVILERPVAIVPITRVMNPISPQ